MTKKKKSEEETKYIQDKTKIYAICKNKKKGVNVALGSNIPSPLPDLLRLSQSSLKTPHLNIPTHVYPFRHENITKHDYVTKPVSLEMSEAL